MQGEALAAGRLTPANRFHQQLRHEESILRSPQAADAESSKRRQEITEHVQSGHFKGPVLTTGLLVMASGPQEGDGGRRSKSVVQCSATVPSATQEWREGTGPPLSGGPDAITKRPVAITEPF